MANNFFIRVVLVSIAARILKKPKGIVYLQEINEYDDRAAYIESIAFNARNIKARGITLYVLFGKQL